MSKERVDSMVILINTLALSVLERTRELGVLRAIGFSRGQTISMITVEAVVISVFGALLGVGVGARLGASVVRALRSQGFGELALPWQQMATYVALAAVVGVWPRSYRQSGRPGPTCWPRSPPTSNSRPCGRPDPGAAGSAMSGSPTLVVRTVIVRPLLAGDKGTSEENMPQSATGFRRATVRSEVG